MVSGPDFFRDRLLVINSMVRSAVSAKLSDQDNHLITGVGVDAALHRRRHDVPDLWCGKANPKRCNPRTRFASSAFIGPRERGVRRKRCLARSDDHMTPVKRDTL